MTTPEEQVATAIARGNPETPVVGDIYDTETGDYLGAITDKDDELIKEAPLKLDIFFNGYWYTYTISERIKHEKAEAKSSTEG